MSRAYPAIRLRLEALAPRISALGVRSLAELLIDIAAATQRPEIIVRRAEAFAALTPEMVLVARADRFPCRLSLLPDERRSA